MHSGMSGHALANPLAIPEPLVVLVWQPGSITAPHIPVQANQ